MCRICMEDMMDSPDADVADRHGNKLKRSHRQIILRSMLLGPKICHLWHFGGLGVVGNVRGYSRRVGIT